MRFHWIRGIHLAVGLLLACDVPLERFARPDASGEDGPIAACERPSELCDGVCVNVVESSTSCGTCGHDCGGGACAGGACQPVVVASADQLDQPAALAVNATAIFWTERTRVRSCPLASGCAQDPKLIADAYLKLNAIGVTDDAVYFTGCRTCFGQQDLRRCPVSGCPDPVPYVTTTTLGYEEIIVGRTRAYWRDGSEALLECEHADCAGSDVRWPYSDFGGELLAAATDGSTVYVKPVGTGFGSELRACTETMGCGSKRLVTNSSRITAPFRVHDGSVFWLAAGPLTGLVKTCVLANCGDGTTFAEDDQGSTEIEVDDTGVYWLSPSGAIRHCPLLGCPPDGPRTLVSGRSLPKELTLGAGFVYWIESNAIFKVAKP
ncbi:MAG TPA: hypothetical protein VNO30_29795 [Kofleriaceae bacterium]|nr:hypothetical protein [Kofleriaceae bacterium]